MNNFVISHYRRNRETYLIVAAAILAVLVIQGAAIAATTISTNISTEGTLGVTGHSTLTTSSSTVVSMTGNFMINGFATTTAASGNIATEGNMSVATTTGKISIATTTPSQELAVQGDAYFESGATTSVIIHSFGNDGSEVVGGCIQLTGTDGNTYRLYATSASPAAFEAGDCQSG
jgi:hypothetical protein